jgi:hypothetical protein
MQGRIQTVFAVLGNTVFQVPFLENLARNCLHLLRQKQINHHPKFQKSYIEDVFLVVSALVPHQT